jgi:hypothetical protein
MRPTAAPPPLLLLAALLFWGWQTDFFLVGALMGVILEWGRWSRFKWDFSDDDFRRIWVFCSLVLLAATVYAFTTNDSFSSFRGLLSNPTPHSERTAGMSVAKGVASLVKWLPMVFYFFVVAQVFSVRNGVPLETISLIMRWRWRKQKRTGQSVAAGRVVNVCYPYLGICLLAASVHTEEDKSYFWGTCVLLAWALWPHRSRRGGLLPWAAAMALMMAAGYYGQAGLNRFQRYIESLNVYWLAGAERQTDPSQTRTAIGQIGRIQNSSEILIRLETKEGQAPPTLLREASYREYRDQSRAWEASSSRKDEFTQIIETNETSFTLMGGKQDTQAVTIACYLPGGRGLLPIPQPASKLENLFVYQLEKNPGGALRAQGPGLVIFDAMYGPGAAFDAPPIVFSSTETNQNDDLQVPFFELLGIDEAIKQIPLTGTNRAQILHAVSSYFGAEFSYTTYLQSADEKVSWPDFPRRGGRGGFRGTNDFYGTNGLRLGHWRYYGTNDPAFLQSPRRKDLLVRAERSARGETPLSRFLLKSHKGHCEYFATATVLILRRLGVPARYAVGFSVHEGSDGKYVVRGRDAHAWCLVWNADRRTWDDFDTTPATWFPEENARASSFRGLLDVWSNIKFFLAKVWWGQTHMRQYLLYALVPALGFLLSQIILRSRRSRRKNEPKKSEVFNWPGLDSEFYQLEKKLAALGLQREPGQPVFEWLRELLAEPVLQPNKTSLERIAGLHYRYRFDPNGLTSEEREILRREARQCVASL